MNDLNVQNVVIIGSDCVGEQGRGCISRSTIIDKCYSSILINDYFCSKFLTSLLFQRVNPTDWRDDNITITFGNKILFKIGVG